MEEPNKNEFDEDSEIQAKVKSFNKLSSKLKKIVIFIVIIIIIIGLVSHLILLYLAAGALELGDKKVKDLKKTSLLEYEITFYITLENPTDTDIEIEKITYNAYLEDDFLGSGEKNDFTISPGSKKYTFNLKFNLNDLSSAVKNQFISSSALLKIDGVVTVPIKLFGAIKVTELSLDYVLTSKLAPV